MTEAKKIVELFKRADKMIVDYLGMIDNMQRHIRARIKDGTPLPHGAVVALHHGVENNIAWLTRALSDLEDDKRVVATHLASMRKALNTDVKAAKRLLGSWPNNVERSMETVINTFYKSSDILPPPLIIGSQ